MELPPPPVEPSQSPQRGTTQSDQRASRRQLQMHRPHLEELPECAPPPGFAVRTYLPGDEDAWAAIMDSPSGIPIPEGWSFGEVRRRIVDRPEFAPSGLFFACDQSRPTQPPVASACAWRGPEPATPQRGFVHMVAALPAYRGRGLGRAVTVAVLHAMRARGDIDAMLQTDDWRIAAIRTYLGLGFTPVYRPDDRFADDDHRSRWSSVFVRCATGGDGGR